MLRFLIPLCCFAPFAQADGVLMLGDSILDWNQDSRQTVADYLSEELDARVQNNAVSGAVFSANGLLDSWFGEDIQSQYVPGDWDYVVLDGGGNDIGEECDCGACEDTLEALISLDGTQGEIPEFLEALVTAGHKVIWLDYYRPPEGNPLEQCLPEFEAFTDRLQSMRITGVTYTSAAWAVGSQDLSLYDLDLLHPSPKGAALIAGHLADLIKP